MPRDIGLTKRVKKKATVADLNKPFPEASKQSGRFFNASLDEGVDNAAIRRSRESRRKRGINR